MLVENVNWLGAVVVIAQPKQGPTFKGLKTLVCSEPLVPIMVLLETMTLVPIIPEKASTGKFHPFYVKTQQLEFGEPEVVEACAASCDGRHKEDELCFSMSGSKSAPRLALQVDIYAPQLQSSSFKYRSRDLLPYFLDESDVKVR